MSALRCLLLLCVLSPGAVFAQPMQGMHRADGPSAANDSAPSSMIGKAFVDPPPVPQEHAPAWAGSLPIGEELGGSYTLDELLSLALQNNPTVLQARLQINGELARAMQAGLYPNPVVSYVGDQMGENGTPGEWQGAEIKQRFVTAGKLDLSRSKYLQRARVAEHLAVAQQFRVCNDIRVHFAKSLAALEVADLRRELLKTSEDQRSDGSRDVQSRPGESGPGTSGERHAATASPAGSPSENDVRRHLIELSHWSESTPSPRRSKDRSTSERVADRLRVGLCTVARPQPRVAGRLCQTARGRHHVDRESVQWVPDLVVTGGSGHNFIERQATAAAKLSIEIPLFDRNQGTVRQAQADYTRQQSEIRRTQLDLRRGLAAEYDAYLTAYQHVTE